MQTPAQQHFAAVMAKRHGNPAPEAAADSAYEQTLFRLRLDQRRLAQIASRSKKCDLKKELLPAYEGWLAGTLAANAAKEDEIITTCFIWMLDVGWFDRALELARYLLQHALALPAQYKRTPACLLVDEIADAALRPVGTAALPETVSLALLNKTVALTQDKDMPDEARAKLYKAIGLRTHALGDSAGALAWLQKALALHPGVGVKKEIEQLQRCVKKLPPAAADNTQSGPTR